MPVWARRERRRELREAAVAVVSAGRPIAAACLWTGEEGDVGVEGSARAFTVAVALLCRRFWITGGVGLDIRAAT